jgi:hypothetical protein
MLRILDWPVPDVLHDTAAAPPHPTAAAAASGEVCVRHDERGLLPEPNRYRSEQDPL